MPGVLRRSRVPGQLARESTNMEKRWLELQIIRQPRHATGHPLILSRSVLLSCVLLLSEHMVSPILQVLQPGKRNPAMVELIGIHTVRPALAQSQFRASRNDMDQMMEMQIL